MLLKYFFLSLINKILKLKIIQEKQEIIFKWGTNKYLTFIGHGYRFLKSAG